MAKTITVTIDEQGSIEIDVQGVVGSECETYTKAIVKALSATVQSDEKKPEYFMTQGEEHLKTKG